MHYQLIVYNSWCTLHYQLSLCTLLLVHELMECEQYEKILFMLNICNFCFCVSVDYRAQYSIKSTICKLHWPCTYMHENKPCLLKKKKKIHTDKMDWFLWSKKKPQQFHNIYVFLEYFLCFFFQCWLVVVFMKYWSHLELCMSPSIPIACYSFSHPPLLYAIKLFFSI